MAIRSRLLFAMDSNCSVVCIVVVHTHHVQIEEDGCSHSRCDHMMVVEVQCQVGHSCIHFGCSLDRKVDGGRSLVVPGFDMALCSLGYSYIHVGWTWVDISRW